MNKLKIKSVSLENMKHKKLQEVYDYLKKECPNDLPLDGIDFYENEALKDGNYHFFFGSVFRDSSGNWYVPYVRWDGSSFRRDMCWLGSDWNSGYRVVLLETVLDFDLLVSLELRVTKLEKKINKK